MCERKQNFIEKLQDRGVPDLYLIIALFATLFAIIGLGVALLGLTNFMVASGTWVGTLFLAMWYFTYGMPCNAINSNTYRSQDADCYDGMNVFLIRTMFIIPTYLCLFLAVYKYVHWLYFGASVIIGWFFWVVGLIALWAAPTHNGYWWISEAWEEYKEHLYDKKIERQAKKIEKAKNNVRHQELKLDDMCGKKRIM